MPTRPPAGKLARVAAPLVLLPVALQGSGRSRRTAAAALMALWSTSYARYRRRGLAQTQEEWELMRTATPEAFARHYNESVPTLEEELDLWGEYHGHRHKMRYRLLADLVRE